MPVTRAEDTIPVLDLISETDEPDEEPLSHKNRPSSAPQTLSEEERAKREAMIKHLEDQRINPIPSTLNISQKEFEDHIRAERLIAEKREIEDRDRELAIKISQDSVHDPKLKSVPIEVQHQLWKDVQNLNLIKRKSSVSERTFNWCKGKVNFRYRPSRILKVHISGRTTSKGPNAEVKLFRENGQFERFQAQAIIKYGLSEWLELRSVIHKSQSKYKNFVEELINEQIDLVSSTLDIPIPPPPTKQKQRTSAKKKILIDSVLGPPIRNETGIGFSREEVLGPDADISGLNTSLPPGETFIAGKVLSEPHGIFFLDYYGRQHFQRISELPITPIEQLRDLIDWCELRKDPLARQLKLLIFEEALNKRNQGVKVPDWMIPTDKTRDELLIKEEPEDW